jgi:hypothetical protein
MQINRRNSLRLLSLGVVLAAPVHAEDVSTPAILQWYDCSWKTMEKRTGDLFAAGYGSVWTPPPGRADSGNASVGYDVYNRFDLGSAGNATLYGTETGLKTTVQSLHRAEINFYSDNVSNHNGFSNQNTTGFAASGGYPGFFLSNGGDANGDFHPGTATSTQEMRISGLIDIDQAKNYQAIRNPVPGFANNLPAGTVPRNGRLANVPDENNRRFYPDRALAPIVVSDPATGQQNISLYRFNSTNPLAGDPIPETNLQYVARYAQWMVQAIGVDGFRFDAAKHMDDIALPAIDQAVFRASTRTLLDGSQRKVFSFQEVYDGNRAFQQTFIQKTINPDTPNVVGANRDVLDFPLFFALRDNLNQNGVQNNWNNVINAGMDTYDDGKHNGSQGVIFVQSHDDFGPDFGNVAYAYALMQPGNAIVYHNAKEFGNNRGFPKTGRNDALGGYYGERITTLVELRNTHGRGNWKQRYLNKELFAFERQNSALILLNNRGDAGFDERNMLTGFAPGTHLVELTGNAADLTLDPDDDIPQTLTVSADGSVDARFLRNRGADDTLHGNGYLIYGLATPKGSMSLTGLSKTIAPETATAANNGTVRLSAIDFVQGNSFTVNLSTQAVTLPDGFRDRSADGDSAVLKIGEGVDLNGNGQVDTVTPGSVRYGFESFTTVNSPGYSNANGNGQYSQTIDTTQFSEGYHYLEARVFRQRSDGGPEIYAPFTRTLYIDRLPAISAVDSFAPTSGGAGNSTSRTVQVRSVDLTANNIHVFLNLGAALSDAQIIAMVNGNSQGTQLDRDLWKKDLTNVPSGNNVITTVSYEISGRYSIQRFAGYSTLTTRGSGLGDTNFDNLLSAADVNDANTGFEKVLYSQNSLFNPAADVNADGRVDNNDLFALPALYQARGASSATQTEARAAVLRRGNLNNDGQTNQADINHLYANRNSGAWIFDLDSLSNPANQGDVDVLVRTILRSEYGDANLDGAIDTIDFNALAANFGTNSGWGNGNFNGDAIIDTVDFNLLVSHYGFHAAPAASLGVVVPEPSCLALLLPLWRRPRRG